MLGHTSAFPISHQCVCQAEGGSRLTWSFKPCDAGVGDEAAWSSQQYLSQMVACFVLIGNSVAEPQKSKLPLGSEEGQSSRAAPSRTEIKLFRFTPNNPINIGRGAPPH